MPPLSSSTAPRGRDRLFLVAGFAPSASGANCGTDADTRLGNVGSLEVLDGGPAFSVNADPKSQGGLETTRSPAPKHPRSSRRGLPPAFLKLGARRVPRRPAIDSGRRTSSFAAALVLALGAFPLVLAALLLVLAWLVLVLSLSRRGLGALVVIASAPGHEQQECTHQQQCQCGGCSSHSSCLSPLCGEKPLGVENLTRSWHAFRNPNTARIVLGRAVALKPRRPP
jgi:hypothetical protein